MSEERRKILDMLANGKITVEQAEKLLNAIGEADVETHRAGHKESFDYNTGENQKTPGEVKSSTDPKYLRILVNSVGKDGHPPEQVNIKIPLGIIKAGIKIGSVMPDSAKEKISRKLGEKGIDLDLNNIDKNSIDELLMALKEMKIEVNDANGEQVRIFTE